MDPRNPQTLRRLQVLGITVQCLELRQIRAVHALGHESRLTRRRLSPTVTQRAFRRSERSKQLPSHVFARTVNDKGV